MKLSKLTILAVLALVAAVTIPAINGMAKGKEVTKLTNENTVLVNEEVNSTSVGKWILKARELDAKGSASDPIYLVVNSPGGSISDGLQFIEAMKGLRRPVHTVTMFAASMGFQIVQNLGDRLILKTGTLMSHHARGQVSGEYGGVSSTQMGSRYADAVNTMKELDEQTVSRTKGKQTLESYQKAYDHEMWLSGIQSVNQGYADKVVVAACDESLNGTNSNEGSFMGIALTYDLSNCPLITGPMNIKATMLTNKGPMNEKDFLEKGGQFGASCLLNTDPNKICSLDTTLTLQKLSEIKQLFDTDYMAKQNKVVYMYFSSK